MLSQHQRGIVQHALKPLDPELVQLLIGSNQVQLSAVANHSQSVLVFALPRV